MHLRYLRFWAPFDCAFLITPFHDSSQVFCAMQLGLSSSLRRLVTAKFESALANKSLTLSETDLVVVRVAGLPVRAARSRAEYVGLTV